MKEKTKDITNLEARVLLEEFLKEEEKDPRDPELLQRAIPYSIVGALFRGENPGKVRLDG